MGEIAKKSETETERERKSERARQKEKQRVTGVNDANLCYLQFQVCTKKGQKGKRENVET